MTQISKIRYEIVSFDRAKKGFKAVIVDNRHPSGVSGIPVMWFVDADAAKRHLGKTAYTVTQGK